MREKAHYVLNEVDAAARPVRRRLARYDGNAVSIPSATFHPFLADEIVRRGAAHAGMNWHFARPPVRDLEFEIDCRAVRTEEVV